VGVNHWRVRVHVSNFYGFVAGEKLGDILVFGSGVEKFIIHVVGETGLPLTLPFFIVGSLFLCSLRPHEIHWPETGRFRTVGRGADKMPGKFNVRQGNEIFASGRRDRMDAFPQRVPVKSLSAKCVLIRNRHLGKGLRVGDGLHGPGHALPIAMAENTQVLARLTDSNRHAGGGPRLSPRRETRARDKRLAPGFGHARI